MYLVKPATPLRLATVHQIANSNSEPITILFDYSIFFGNRFITFCSLPVQMPMVLFDDDAECRKGFAFCAAALRAGAYFHPRHNMFISAAHTEDDIAIALAAAEKGFAAAAALG